MNGVKYEFIHLKYVSWCFNLWSIAGNAPTIYVLHSIVWTLDGRLSKPLLTFLLETEKSFVDFGSINWTSGDLSKAMFTSSQELRYSVSSSKWRQSKQYFLHSPPIGLQFINLFGNSRMSARTSVERNNHLTETLLL